MKILVICGAGQLFGKEGVTLSLMEGLRARGHEVRCISSTWRDGRFEKRLQELSIPYDLLPLGFVSKTLRWSSLQMTLTQALKVPQLWMGYRKVVSYFEPHVVLHSTFHHVFLLWPLLGKRRLNIFHVHDTFASTPFYRRLFSILSKRIDFFVGVSGFVAQTLITLGVPEAKVRFVLNGIAPIQSCSSSTRGDALKLQQMAQSKRPVRVGIVGQVGEWKGHEDLIDALYILKEMQESFVCRIFGSGKPEFAAKLKSKINAYELRNEVEWMGFVDKREVIYGGIDVCVVPSRTPEGFGMVAAEAVMYGVPVIASRIGALPEVVLGEELGYLVDVRSPQQIADRILEISTHRGKSSGIGRGSNLTTPARLTAKRMVDDVESLFESLIAAELNLAARVN